MQNKNIIVIIFSVIVLALLIWLLAVNKQSTFQPLVENNDLTAPANDSAATIDQDLQGINIGDLEQEFQGIDQDLNSL
jgi:lipopolysaccharide export system protein LptC